MQDQVLARAYVYSFPLSLGALIYFRVRYALDWPLPGYLGLVILASATFLLFCDIFFEDAFGQSASMRRLALYLHLWMALLGLWLYGKFFSDVGLGILVALASGLWPASCLELLKLKHR